MSSNGYINLKNTDNLKLYIDSYNKRSYIDGNTVANDLGANDFGKTDFSVSAVTYVTGVYDNKLLMSDRNTTQQSIYNIDTDLSYKIGNFSAEFSGGEFDDTEIVNGLPVIYSCGFSPTSPPISRGIRKFEAQVDGTYTQTYNQSIGSRYHSKINVDKYNQTSGENDLWVSSSNWGGNSNVWLTLQQWNGSSYDTYDFTSLVSSYLTRSNKFVNGVAPVSSGRIFVFCQSYNNATTRQDCIVELQYTSGTYSIPGNWTATLRGGKTGAGTQGNTDGELGTNSIGLMSIQPPSPMYEGTTKNGEPNIYFTNFYPTSFGAVTSDFALRELFYNGSAWEIQTHFATSSTFHVIESDETASNFYFQSHFHDKLFKYNIELDSVSEIVDITESSVQQQRVPKTIDLINGVGFDNKSWTFDGVNQYIDCNGFEDIVKNDTQGTLEMWLTPIIPTNENKMLFSFNDTTDQSYINFRIVTDGTANANIRNNGSLVDWVIETDDVIFENNIPIHLVFVQDGVAVKMYKNGELLNTTFTNNTDTSSWITDMTDCNSVLIGAQNYDTGTPDRFYSGDISIVKYYNVGLSADEVKQNYDSLKWRFQ